MNKFALILFMTLVAVGLHAQQPVRFRTDAPHGLQVGKSTPDELSLHYSIQELGIANIDNGEAKGQEIIMKGSFGSFAAGLPNLPSENHYIAVPQGATVSVEITENGVETLRNIGLLPAAEVIRNDVAGLPKLYKDINVFSRDDNFPSQNVKITQTTQIRGLDVVLLNITPFRYNPVRKTLEVVYDMDIKVRFEGGDGQFGEARYRNPDWDGILRNLVVNSNMLPEAHYYELVNQTVRNSEEGCEYLIISPDDEAILAWADTLKQFRSKQGILTKVVTTTTCGGNTTEAIKGYIQNAYEHWAIPPAAVMLFGDLPAFPLIFLNYAGTGLNYDYYSDNPYADMNGDTIPDLTLSRLPAFNINDYHTVINKLIQYENNPPTNPDYYSHPIITSGYEDNKWFLITSQAVDGFYRNKLGKQPRNFYMLYQHNSGPIPLPDTAWSTGYNTNVVIDYFGPHGQNYIAQRPDTLHCWRNMYDNSYLLDALNQGSFLTFYRDHSSSDLWCCPWIDVTDLLRLTHPTDPTFLLSIGCHTGELFQSYYGGNIYRTPLIAAFCNDKIGALGGIGAATVTHSHYNDMLTWGFLDYIWPDFMPGLGSANAPTFNRPAYALVAGKLFLNQHVFMPNWWPGNITTTQNVFHDLGETYLSLNTEVPQPIAIHAEPFTDSQTVYTFTAEKGALVCLWHEGEILCVTTATGKDQQLSLPHLAIGEQLCFTVTMKNKNRHEQKVTVISPDQPYVYTQQFQINESDLNGQFDAGEMVTIDLILHNSSLLTSDHGTLTLYCNSPYVEVVQDMATYPPISPKTSLALKRAFQVKIPETVPDQASLEFAVLFDENENTHKDRFSYKVNAPILNISPEIQFLTADGQPSTHIQNEGSSKVLFTVNNNGHSNARYLCSTLHIKAPFVEIETPTYMQQDLAPNEALLVAFDLNTLPNSLTGAWLQSKLEIQYGKNLIQLDTILQYGGIIEDFETEELNPYFKWVNTGSHKWVFCAEDPYEGQYCFVSNAETTFSSTLKAQLKQTYTNHHSKLSFYYKTGEEDTLTYYNTNTNKALLSSNEWQYAEVDYNGTDHYFYWSFKQRDNDNQAKIDNICFPPIHTVIAYAGEDMVSCSDNPVELSSAYAYDFERLQWTSEGDGEFNDNNAVNPVYTPGSQDLIRGSVILTLSAFGDDTIVSSTQIHFMDEISLGSIIGDSIVNQFMQPISHYSIESQPGLHYQWQLEPAHAGIVYRHGNAIDILWNPLESDLDVNLMVIPENPCVTASISKTISLVGYATTEHVPSSFNLFPNPTDGKISLVVDEAFQGTALIEVYNLLGERLIVKKIGKLPKNKVVELDLSNLSPGLYIVKFSTKESSLSKKVSLR